MELMCLGWSWHQDKAWASQKWIQHSHSPSPSLLSVLNLGSWKQPHGNSHHSGLTPEDLDKTRGDPVWPWHKARHRPPNPTFCLIEDQLWTTWTEPTSARLLSPRPLALVGATSEHRRPLQQPLQNQHRQREAWAAPACRHPVVTDRAHSSLLWRSLICLTLRSLEMLRLDPAPHCLPGPRFVCCLALLLLLEWNRRKQGRVLQVSSLRWD